MGLLLIWPLAAWPAEPAAEVVDPFAKIASDFEQNTALGTALSIRDGTPEEFAQVRALADRGLKRARNAVEQSPDSAAAHYWLGSWLLYGYGVVEVDRVTFDPESGGRTETITQVVQGLTGQSEDGLDALKRTTELAPENGRYLLDYAMALGDYGRLVDARALLRAAWFGRPALSGEEKMEAGLLLSDAAVADGNLAAAREWVYSALALDPATAQGVERLRYLDAAQAAEAAVEAAE
jgi:hypothetical protein